MENTHKAKNSTLKFTNCGKSWSSNPKVSVYWATTKILQQPNHVIMLSWTLSPEWTHNQLWKKKLLYNEFTNI